MYSVAFIFLIVQDKGTVLHSEQKTFSLNGQVVNIFFVIPCTRNYPSCERNLFCFL